MSLSKHSDPSTPAADPWLTLREASARAKVHHATLRRAIADGELRHARIGGRRNLRLRPEWIDQWLEGAAVAVTSGAIR